ncbi:uncharacterized protein LOC134660802 [Cydia amplana]|uniref:uncharacterized protein LOC134647277 n=1 Tax=Cydia amplana TaxID=1869771 RepID=UPI002FE5A5F6
MQPRKLTRYEPKTSRLKTILDRCRNPSNQNSEDIHHSVDCHNIQLPDHYVEPTSSHEKPVEKGLPKHCVQEMVNEVNRRNYSLTSDIFNNFNEYATTQSKSSVFLSNAVDLLQQAFPATNTEKQLDLRCDEELSISSRSSSSSHRDDDFSSDDSVRDKNYIPETSSSDDSENKIAAPVLNKHPNKHSHMSMFNTTNIIKRRNTINIEIIPDTQTNKIGERILKRRNTTELNYIPTINNSEEISIDLSGENGQSSPAPKRKKYDTSLSERNADKKEDKRLEYLVKPGCDSKCHKKCTTLLTDEEREDVNDSYWNLTWKERRLFIQNNVPVVVPKRQKTGPNLRAPRRTFFLRKHDDTKVAVCKIFFLTTLGFNKTNDKVLYNSLADDDLTDSRGKHTKTLAYDREILRQHVESFHPLEPHYRRAHAPNRRYLPSDVTITFMHDHFCKKYPQDPVSYELYRQVVKEMNISFTNLGNEECEVCESYQIHKKESSHNIEENILDNCEDCTSFAIHHDKYVAARKLYEEHKTEQDPDNIYFSADLQKVIMLPRLDTFKKIIFCLRLATYNQTFAPLGKITSSIKPYAVLWHDAIAGRKQEDIMSAFFSFFLQYRDTKHVNIWLDNCSAQNKNWLLYSMLVHMVNSDYIGTESITLYYFEPGHTFMSCDQFHHQVELSMKHKGKIYDFADFTESVGSANKGKVTVKSMVIEDFINVPNFTSERRIQNSNPRVYLRDITQACFTRGCYDLSYKTEFKNDYQQLRFLNDKYLKNPSPITFPKRVDPKGTDVGRKKEIINKCSQVIPTHKLKFWRDLPESR